MSNRLDCLAHCAQRFFEARSGTHDEHCSVIRWEARQRHKHICLGRSRSCKESIPSSSSRLYGARRTPRPDRRRHNSFTFRKWLDAIGEASRLGAIVFSGKLRRLPASTKTHGACAVGCSSCLWRLSFLHHLSERAALCIGVAPFSLPPERSLRAAKHERMATISRRALPDDGGEAPETRENTRTRTENINGTTCSKMCL